MTEWKHQSVLLPEVVSAFPFGGEPRLLIDGTLGNGGHSAALLRAYPGLRILGIDRDADALARARDTLAFARDRVTLVHGEFSALADHLRGIGETAADGVLLDIGVSSPQLDDPARGFSWRTEGPLDMRMDRSRPETASRLLNRASEAELAAIFRDYGELRAARKLAAAAVKARAEKPFATTLDLVELCDDVLGRSRPGQLPAPTLVFQANRRVKDVTLRRVVNCAAILFALFVAFLLDDCRGGAVDELLVGEFLHKSEEEMRKMSKGQLKMLMSGFSIDSSISKSKAPEKVL